MIHYCTYFDSGYIHKGVALYQSLVRTGHPFTLWVLCFDTAAYHALEQLDLPNVRLISECQFERSDAALLSVKPLRSRIEYYWTCTPSLPLHVLRQDPTIGLVVYLDADTYFFSSPKAILEELGEGNVLIVPHDYAAEYAQHQTSGLFNVGIMAFRNNAEGIAVLKWWREKCLEWCYWRHEDGKIGDQAYLNDWPDRFAGVVVSKHSGINAAPWNVAKYGVTVDARSRLFVGTKPLVCFHFHACSISTSIVALVAGFKVALSTSTLSLIYRPYIDQLFEVERLLLANGINIRVPRSGFPWRYVIGRLVRRQPVRHFLWIRGSSAR